MITNDLQWRQEEHDRLFHSDIYNLDRQKRLTHLALHLMKYNGKLYNRVFFDDPEKLRPVVVDAIIVLVSSLNTLNTTPLIAGELNETVCNRDDIIIETGGLAKLLEGLDHFEDNQIRVHYRIGVTKLLRYWRVFYDITHPELTLEEAVVERLKAVERKNMFFNEIVETHPWLV